MSQVCPVCDLPPLFTDRLLVSIAIMVFASLDALSILLEYYGAQELQGSSDWLTSVVSVRIPNTRLWRAPSAPVSCFKL